MPNGSHVGYDSEKERRWDEVHQKLDRILELLERILKNQTNKEQK